VRAWFRTACGCRIKIMGICRLLNCFSCRFLKQELIYGLSYRTPRYVRVNIWQVAVFHNLMVLGALIYVAFSILQLGSYSYSASPVGTVNAWSEGYETGFDINKPDGFQYCSSLDHDYVYSPGWAYVQPKCRILSSNHVVTKGTDDVSFTTNFIETESYKWRCGSNASSAKVLRCGEMGASVATNAVNPSQCSCSHSETFFVKGIEELQLAFEHSYMLHGSRSSTANAVGSNGGELAGVSSQYNATWPLQTKVIFPDGHEALFTGGQTVKLSLKSILAIAGAGLDKTNHDVIPDCRMANLACEVHTKSRADGTTPSRYPRYRTTGIRINVDLLYTNRKGYYEDDFNLAPLLAPNVTARFNATQVRMGWAGEGPKSENIEMPIVDADGVETTSVLTRYRQGVVLVFRPSGKIYSFSWTHLLSTVINGVVLVGIAKVITDFVVFYLLPDGVSEVMRNKRAEKVNKIQAFARALPSMRFELRVLREDTQNSFRLVLLIKLTSCVCMLASPQKSA
jgi:hypothetical protein